MIVFYGFSEDPPLKMAIDAAVDLGLEHVVVDQRQAAFHDICLRVGPKGVDGELIVASAHLPLANISAVYARPLEPVRARDPGVSARITAVHSICLEWLDVADCLVVSRPSAMNSNSSKPFQIQEIAAAGFLVPETLVTSEPEEARAFWADRGEVIFKSASGIRSIVRRLDTAKAQELDRIRTLPTQFQALVPGVDVRVHVVGCQVFATEVRSGATDYRYAGREGLKAELEPRELPAAVVERCLRLARRLGLPFCGIDLRCRPDGEYVCFEVNPMPGYSYFENETGQPISRALVEFLAGGVW